jgi:hypothetical protein
MNRRHQPLQREALNRGPSSRLRATLGGTSTWQRKMCVTDTLHHVCSAGNTRSLAARRLGLFNSLCLPDLPKATRMRELPGASQTLGTAKHARWIVQPAVTKLSV